MKSIFKHLMRNISEKKLRTTILIFTILFSTMVLFIALSLNTIMNDTYQTILKGTYVDANIIITKENDETDPFYESAAIDTDSISIDARADIIQATGKTLLNNEREKVQIMGTSFENAEDLGLVNSLQTTSNFTLSDNEAVISQKTASDFDLDTGDTLKVSLAEKTRTFRIAAISETNGVFYRELDDIQVIIPHQTLQDILAAGSKFTSSLLQVPEDDLSDSIAALKENNTNAHFSIQKPGAHESKTRDTETFQITMIAAIAIIILIGSYVIISLAKVIVTERLPVIGTFRSIGTTKRTMHSILALEFLIYGLIGATLGIITAYFLLPFVADIFNEYKTYGVETDVSYNVAYITISYFFGLIFPTIISLFHIIKASSKPLKDTILNTAQTKKERSMITVIMGFIFVCISFTLFFINKQDDQLPAAISFFLLLLGILFLMPVFLNGISLFLGRLMKNIGSGELLLSIKNIANNKVVVNNCSMIIVVFLLMLMIGTTGKGLDSYVTNALQSGYDIIISDLDEDPSEYEAAADSADITDTNVLYIDLASYNINNKSGEFSMIAVDDINAFASFYDGVGFKGDAKDNFSRTKDGVIIDAYQKDRYGLEIGDTIQLKTTSSQDDTDFFDVVIAGVMDGSVLNSNKTSVLIHKDIYSDHFTTETPKIALKVRNGTDAETVKKELSEKYVATNLSIHTFEEMIAGQKETIDTLLSGIIVVVLFGLLIGLLGITNNFIVSFIQRKKEYAVLYSVSMSRSQLIKMLFYEMLMTFVALLIIGFIGGYAMFIIMVKLLVSLGLVIPISFHYGLFGILSGAAFILLALSTLSTVKRVKQLNILKQLRYE